MHTDVVLTVSESKRLIARGIAAHPVVKSALMNGYVVICKGSTNAYVVEELLGRKIVRTDYVTGHTLPRKYGGERTVSSKLPEVVLKDGKVVSGTSSKDIARELGPGDVFIKGANALNYERGQAALLIGHPAGGTMGASVGVLVARRVHVLIPVGLEKSVPGDLNQVARLMSKVRESGSGAPAFWPIEGEIFTEIETLSLLAGVRATMTGSGGIGGAEGAVRLLLEGSAQEIETACDLVDSVLGEPPFLT